MVRRIGRGVQEEDTEDTEDPRQVVGGRWRTPTALTPNCLCFHVYISPEDNSSGAQTRVE
jgi:hypothetical protein